MLGGGQSIEWQTDISGQQKNNTTPQISICSTSMGKIQQIMKMELKKGRYVYRRFVSLNRNVT